MKIVDARLDQSGSSSKVIDEVAFTFVNRSFFILFIFEMPFNVVDVSRNEVVSYKELLTNC